MQRKYALFLTAVFSLFMAASCGDITAPEAGDDPALASLETSAGTLEPAFNPDTTEYTLLVPPGIFQVELRASPRDPGAHISPEAVIEEEIDFTTTNTPVFSVYSADWSRLRVYTVHVSGESPAQGNTALDSVLLLDENGQIWPITDFGAEIFSPGLLEYELSLPSRMEKFALSCRAAEEGAEVHTGGEADDQGFISLAYAGGPELQAVTAETPVTVTAANGSQRTYTFRVTRRAPEPENLKLEKLYIGGLADPAFDGENNAYTVKVPWGTSQVIIAAEAEEYGVSLLDGEDQPFPTPGEGGKILQFGDDNDLSCAIKTQGPQGEAGESYEIRIHRMSNNAALAEVSLNGINLEGFSPGVLVYGDETLPILKIPQGTLSIACSAEDPAARAESILNLPLALGMNRVSLTVTAEDPRFSNTYVFYVRRMLNDASLKSLGVTPGTLIPPFDPQITIYTSAAAPSVGSVVITGQKNSSYAVMNPENGVINRPLSNGDNECIIAVTAEDGTLREYRIIVQRYAADNNANLASLSVSGGYTLVPVFTPAQTFYDVTVPNDVTSIRLNAAPANPQASINEGGQITSPLAVGSTAITFTVTAADGFTEKNYTVSVTRQKSAAAVNADLSSLALSDGYYISPAFDPGQTHYSCQVPYTRTTITATAVKSYQWAGMTPDDGLITRSLNVGSNVLRFSLVSEDGSKHKDYTIDVIRAAPSGNNYLASLSVSGGGGLSPAFSPEQLLYDVTVPYTASSVTVTPVLQDTNFGRIRINGLSAGSGSGRLVTLSQGMYTQIGVEVTAQDTSVREYTVTVTREPPDPDNNLSGLTVKRGNASGVPVNLNPLFSQAVISYELRVVSATTQVTVYPEASSPSSSIQVQSPNYNSGNYGPVSSGAYAVINLNTGTNYETLINIKVTAQDNTTKTYAVTVIRMAQGITLDLTPPVFDDRGQEIAGVFPTGVPVIYQLGTPGGEMESRLTCTVPPGEGYSIVQWYVDGIPMGTGVLGSFSVDAEDYAQGNHYITLTVLWDGAYWSREARFSVSLH
jgi:hypothetical protein